MGRAGLFAAFVFSLAGGQEGGQADRLAERALRAGGKELHQVLDELDRLQPGSFEAMTRIVMEGSERAGGEAIQRLARWRDPRVLAVLEKCAIRDGRPDATVVLAIGNHGNPRGLACLMKLAGSRDPRVSHAVAYALGRLGDPAALPVLKKLGSGPDPSVRWQAAESAKWIRAMTKKYPDRLSDPNAWWRVRAS
jgi:hypothetical protein